VRGKQAADGAAGARRKPKEMTVTGYRRVSKKRPCGICGKPDWCSTTATATISFCARSTLNADRISQHGWGVYYDHNSSLIFHRTFYRIPKRKKSVVPNLLASPAIRDLVYRKLIELSPASSNYEIVNGRGGLRERGIADYSQYGSLPKTVDERTALVERLAKEVTKEFGGKTASFAGIPGFWMDTSDRLRLWNLFDSNDELMLIPFVGRDGQVRACQIRFMRYVRGKSGHYVWLSSSKERMGCGPGSPLHHADPGSSLKKPVLVTEGALKAATTQKFLTDRYVVGNSGVATAHREIVGTAGGRALEIAFDNDSFTNPHVARALAGLVSLRLSDQKAFRYDKDTRILTWDRRIKGIDEALLSRCSLKSLNLAEWLERLSPACLDQARQQFFEFDLSC
jgi:hypothetical protein